MLSWDWCIESISRVYSKLGVPFEKMQFATKKQRKWLKGDN